MYYFDPLTDDDHEAEDFFRFGEAPLATEADAIREWVRNVGGTEQFRDSQWLVSNYDTIENNPFYQGPPQRHPFDDSEDEPEPDDAPFFEEGETQGARFIGNASDVPDLEIPF